MEKRYALPALLIVSVCFVWYFSDTLTQASNGGSSSDASWGEGATYVKSHLADFMVYSHERKDCFPKPVDLIFIQIATCMHVPNMVFMDIGANIGQFVDSVFNIWGRQRYRVMLRDWEDRGVKTDKKRIQGDVTACGDPYVHVFEPMPDNVDVLRKMQVGYPEGHVFLNHAAVSNKPGLMPLYDGGQEGSNTGNTQGGLLQHGSVVANISVTTIDDYVKQHNIKRLDVVKIDVEGFEREVFEGMKHSIDAGILKLFTFEYGEKWKTPRGGYPEGVDLKSTLSMLDSWGFDSFLVGFHCWMKINGDMYNAYYEDVAQLVSVEVVSVHRRHNKYKRLTAPAHWCT